LVDAFGAYLWWVERPAMEKESEKKLVMTLTPDSVTRVELIRGEDTIELSREGTDWRLTKPLSAPADQRAVEALIRTVAEAEEKRRIDAPESLQQFGLEPPTVVVGLTDRDGKTLPRLAIGGSAPIGFSVYLRRGDEPAVLMTNAAVRSALDKKVDDLRDKTIITFSNDEVREVVLEKRGGERVVVAQDESGWRITEPLEAKADTAEIQSLLGTLRALRAQGFVDESEEAARATQGLDDPQLALTLRMKDGKEERRVLLGNPLPDESKKQLFAQSLPGGQVFLAASTSLVSLSKTAPDLRDKTVLGVDEEKLERVELSRQEGESLQFERKDDDWILAGAGADKPRSLVGKRFVDDLLALKGSAIAAEASAPEALAPYGLDEPEMRIGLKARDGADLGAILLARTGEGEDQRFYAANASGGPIFEVRDYVYRRLDKSRTDFVEPGKPEPAPATAG
jgi:hypothetical protein